MNEETRSASYRIGYGDAISKYLGRLKHIRDHPTSYMQGGSYTQGGWDIQAYFLGFSDGLGDRRSGWLDSK